jgi:hypothetical protein
MQTARFEVLSQEEVERIHPGESRHRPRSGEESMDVRAHNRRAWDQQVASGNPWTVPVSTAVVEAARRGEWQIILTPTKPVPGAWFPALAGTEVLCLASGGTARARACRCRCARDGPGQLPQAVGPRPDGGRARRPRARHR